MELRKKSVAVLAGVAIAGLVGAAAASLGGLNTSSVGADTDVIASCHTADPADVATQIAVDFTTTYNTTVQGYAVDSVQLTNIDSLCNGLTAQVTLLDGTGAVLDDGSVVVAAGAASISVTDVDAEALEEIAVVIS